jgi:pterin-4a-carbinolamine dehydratase
VKVQLSTHDAAGVTDFDFLLAESMNSFAAADGPQ